MKKILSAIFALYMLTPSVHAQKGEYKRVPAIGISYFLTDFISPDRIRTTSLSQVLADKKFARIKQMSPGLAINYFKGISNHVDFAGTLGGAFLNYPMPGKSFSSENFLLEISAQVNLKMTTENYLIQPYIIAGVAGHMYKSYYGATMPLGFGAKINLGDEAHFFINSTYRVPITLETANYHFQHSIGIAAAIGKKKLKS